MECQGKVKLAKYTAHDSTILGAKTQKQNMKPTYSKYNEKLDKKSSMLVLKWGCHFLFLTSKKDRKPCAGDSVPQESDQQKQS